MAEITTYREYPEPVYVQYFDPMTGYGSGNAIGVRETILPDRRGKKESAFHFLVATSDGPVFVWQKYILY